MPTPQEPDFPPGHPARFDYDPRTPAAQEWARRHVHPKGERDFPVDHPKALDTPGNHNREVIRAGVDPRHPELEAFTGRTPEQARAVRAMWLEAAKAAMPSPELEPREAPEPPKHPGSTQAPSGQPATLTDTLRGMAG